MLKNLIIPGIINLIVILTYVIVFTKLFKNASYETKLKPIQVVFWLLIIFEVIKIIYLIGKDGAYYPNRYPIVFCSLVMYLYPLFCFKKNKFSDTAMGLCILPSIFVYIAFIAVQWQYNMNIMNAHSFFYHGSMLAVAIYLITSKLYIFEFKKFYNVFLVLACYIIFASTLSLFIGADISLFGPNVSYLKFIHNLFGFAVGILVLLMVVYILLFVIYGIIHLCSRNNSYNQNEITIKDNIIVSEYKEENIND